MGSLRNCIPARITLLAIHVNSGCEKQPIAGDFGMVTQAIHSPLSRIWQSAASNSVVESEIPHAKRAFVRGVARLRFGMGWTIERI